MSLYVTLAGVGMHEPSHITESGFRKLFDLNPLPMWLFDAQTLCFLEVNDAAIHHYGYSRDEFLSMTLFDIRTPDEVQRFQSFREEATKHPEQVRYTGEWIHRTKDGREIRVEVTSQRFPVGERQAVLSVIKDITERAKSEQLLKESEDRFRMLSEAAVEAIAIHQDFKIMEVNRSFLRMFGLTEAEALGRSPLDFVPEEERPLVLRRINEAHPESYELSLIRADGRRIFVEVHARSIRYRNGTARVVALHDITERKRQESELREREARLEASNKELEQFAYVTSHDLQEPLRMVASYVALLEKYSGALLDENARQYVRFAVEGAKRMKQLIDDLLVFSRIGKKELAPRVVSLKEVMGAVLFDLSLLIKETNAEVTFSDLPEIMGDPSQLKQLLSNLVSNALKFRRQGAPHVEISAYLHHEFWVVRVKDDGIGIDMEYADRIFRIFQRLHTADEYPGTGIGLAICKKIVERHGGKIWVESRHGQGSSFFLTLPAMKALYKPVAI